ncbi:MAG: hypothetical protein H3C62_00815 [Gemmatimonadaceae bacterium]|nr:hypothetical protein [Gemmatimonadaceae bacterium]
MSGATTNTCATCGTELDGAPVCGPCAVTAHKAAGGTIVSAYGSDGNIIADALTGTVLDASPDYAFITRLDVAEYRAWCARVGLAPSSDFDILAIGYWSMHAYEPASADWRADLVDIRRENGELPPATSPAPEAFHR